MHSSLTTGVLAIFLAVSFGFTASPSLRAEDPPISYHEQVRPIFQAKCYGCHQPARDLGSYSMVEFAKLLGPGDSGDHAIVPGKIDESPLLELITPDESGVAEMPQDEPALNPAELALVRLWIEQGAVDDTPKQIVSYSRQQPPQYSRLPVITSLDFSPDGKWLATAGFHEAVLLELGSRKIKHRLIGISPRIESVRFSPDGTRLAVVGGRPGLSGEVQVWKVATGELELSKLVGFDTIYGVSWSPDGTKIAFGSTDTNLRVIDAQTGEQVLFQGAHDDWVRETAWSVDGSKLVSVGRDMTCKLVDFETERFIDNITSITPGVLKGGIASVARHPQRDEILIGGSDGIPKIYRMFRQTQRRIGDDANMIRRMPPMKGRIQAVDISSDGQFFAAGTSLDGSGALAVYAYEFDTALSDELKAILGKTVASRTPEERAKREEYVTRNIKQVATADMPTGVYALRFDPSGKQIALGGSDGMIRLVDTATGNINANFAPFEITSEAASLQAEKDSNWLLNAGEPKSQTDTNHLAKSHLDKVVELDVQPAHLLLSKTDYAQMVVRARTADGAWHDVTTDVAYELPEGAESTAFSISPSGLVERQPGASKLRSQVHVRFQGQSVAIPVEVDVDPNWTPDFIRDVNPVLSRLGCNNGTCHGSAGGKMGFKLSLRGYDPLFDIRAFTDDLSARRVNLASPADSLMLLKPTASVPHQGGQLMSPQDKYYQILHDWIAAGAQLDLDVPRVTSLDVFPANPILAKAGDHQQMRVVATYADGKQRDVTHEAFLEISDTEIAKVQGSRMMALRRGETPVLARYEGAFTATTLTVMGDRSGFAWAEPEVYGPIDEMVAAKWKRMKILPSGLCTDEEFLRRVYLDLTGLPPTSDTVKQFLADPSSSRIKRDAVVDRLIGSPEFVEYWSNKWADLLQVNRKFLGVEGSTAFRQWIREQVETNTPYDQFVSQILTAQGSNKENPPAAYYKILRTPVDTMENTTHLFLGTRFNCNKCHDHPFERWTQDQYYETAAFFAQFQLKEDPASGGKKIGGSAVEAAKPLYEQVLDLEQGDLTHERTGQVAEPRFPFECDHPSEPSSSRRQQFAAWATSADNPYFATSYVNRLWGYLLGVGLIEPLDDIRAGNPPTNPQLLEYLTHEFVEQNFDMRHVLRIICKSRTYQLSVRTNALNDGDKINYSHAMPRRLPAEVLFDSIHFVTGSQSMIPGAPAGTRAAALPDSGARLPSGFLATLGRPARESACECERSNELQLGSVLALVSGPDVARAISDPKNQLAQLVASRTDDRALINELYYRILNRSATEAELEVAQTAFQEIDSDHQQLLAELNERREVAAQMKPKLEKQRAELVAQTQAALDKAIQRIDPQLLQRETAHQERVATAEQALQHHRASANGIEDWKQRQKTEVNWQPVLFDEVTTVSQTAATQREDRTILVAAKDSKDVYTASGKTDLAGITGVRLELLPDESLPAKGPGTAANGNLVLTEFQMEIAKPDQPDQWVPVKFSTAIANFEQNGLPIAGTINGKTGDRGGWALYGKTGQVNWGSYQLAEPIGFPDGTLIRFHLHQNFDNQHQVGCFRISLSQATGELGVSLSESLLAQLDQPQDQLAEPAKQEIQTAFEKSDSKLKQLQAELATAKKPLVIDPEIVRLRDKLKRVSQPVPADAIQARLEVDLIQSEKQLANRRLTATQDLAWALINSPSFLFNR
ncbi:MAG: DUF1549 domain-containing protein [Planctomycetota bacterium]|nr:DUF1549 domain-containing protein [Planctomycetota bacterium]